MLAFLSDPLIIQPFDAIRLVNRRNFIERMIQKTFVYLSKFQNYYAYTMEMLRYQWGMNTDNC